MTTDLATIYPLLAVLGLALAVLGLDLVWPRLRAGLGYLTAVGCAALAVVVLAHPPAGTPFGGMLTVDAGAAYFAALFLAAAALVSLLASRFLAGITKSHGEFYFLLLLSTLGLMTMTAAADLLMLYLGLELSTISLYPLAAYHKSSRRSAEAGLKYVLLGAVSSAVLLYGLTMVYGVAGGTSYRAVAAAQAADNPALLLGLAFVVAGFGFKVAAAPFHMWAPDVYEGAPTPVTAFLSVASKAAGFAVLLRVLGGLFGAYTDTWVALVAFLSMASLIVGNLVAIPQTNLKRMLAYSGIAQAGYILIGVAAASAQGAGFSMFYLAQYTLANVGAFAVAQVVAHATGSEDIAALRGLRTRAPLVAFGMLILLLSLGGIPPLGGFWAKLYVFLAGFQSGLWWLALAGALASVVALYYYLMVVRQMYLLTPAEGDDKPIVIHRPAALAILVCTALTIALAYPAPLVNMALRAGEAIFH